jgi:hypothetical protein
MQKLFPGIRAESANFMQETGVFSALNFNHSETTVTSTLHRRPDFLDKLYKEQAPHTRRQYST